MLQCLSSCFCIEHILLLVHPFAGVEIYLYLLHRAVNDNDQPSAPNTTLGCAPDEDHTDVETNESTICYIIYSMLKLLWTLLDFIFHGLILYELGGYLSSLLCVHNVCMKTVDHHELILCVSGGVFSELRCIRNVDIENFDLHGLILCVSQDLLSE